MSRYVEAPEEAPEGRGVFLAGTITGAGDWQRDLAARLADTDWTIYNPRRANFPIGDPSAAEEQIRWEHRHIGRAALVSFFFPAEGLSPITLYELGKCSAMGKPIAVAVEPGFWREADVRIQTALIRPEVAVGHSLDDLEADIRAAAPGAPEAGG